MSFEVRVQARAEADLREIYEFISREYPDRAARIVNRLLSRIETLDEFPYRGSIPRDELLKRKGYRFLVEGSHLIFYKVVGSRVLVYRVLDSRREYARLL